MHGIEKLSNQIAAQIALKLEIDEDHEAVLSYGAFVVIETLWSILLVMIFGILLNVWLEALVASCTTAVLRKYSGGAHATSPNRCAIIGTIAACTVAVMTHKINTYMDFTTFLIFQVVGVAFVYYVVTRYAPVDTPNKPIKKQEKRKQLRKKAIYTINILTGMILIFIGGYFKTGNRNLLSVATAINGGLIWQAVTLVSVGNFIIYKLDVLLKKAML